VTEDESHADHCGLDGAGTALVGAALVGGWVAFMRSIDQPPYTLVASDGDIQIRDYGAMTVAEVTTTGNRDGAVRAGFRPLAGYIFAKRPGRRQDCHDSAGHPAKAERHGRRGQPGCPLVGAVHHA
jgi:hypothetical protein